MSETDLVSYIERPSLAFRVGVTGSRHLDKQSTDILKTNVQAVLKKIQETVLACHSQERARKAYQHTPPILRIVSPLARGADQLVAQAALDLGFQLHVPMPFEKDVYLRDFDEIRPEGGTEAQGASTDRQRFESLIEKAEGRVLAMDGGESFPGGSYQAVGRHVVRHSDLLVAIWDGQDENGRGGTAQIVRYAAHIGVPVVWFRIVDNAPSFGLAEDASPFWIAEPRDLHTAQHILGRSDLSDDGRRAMLATLAEPTWQRLTERIESELLAEHVQHHPGQGLFQKGAQTFLRSWSGRLLFPTAHPDRQPLQEFLAEKPLRKRVIFRLHDRFLDMVSAVKPIGGYPTETAPPEQLIAVWNYWRPIYSASDELAVGYARRYRSSYVATFGLGALALILAVFGVVLHAFAISLIELVILLAILWLVFANTAFWWQDKLIAYRLLAELCRKQQSLAILGGSLPVRSIGTPTDQGGGTASRPEKEEVDDAPPGGRGAWVSWYFKAMVRAAPVQTGALAALTPEVAGYLRRTLVAGQADYHDNRAERYGKASERLEHSGTWFFFSAILIVLIEMILNSRPVTHAAIWETIPNGEELHYGALLVLGFAVVILPILSAALVGIRSYAELELMEAQSKRMSTIIRRIEKRLIELERRAAEARAPLPLLSQEVEEEIADLANEMLKDVAGWTEVCRVKAVEAG